MNLVAFVILLFLMACFTPSLLILVLLGVGVLLCLLVVGAVSGAIIGLWQGLKAGNSFDINYTGITQNVKKGYRQNL